MATEAAGPNVPDEHANAEQEEESLPLGWEGRKGEEIPARRRGKKGVKTSGTVRNYPHDRPYEKQVPFLVFEEDQVVYSMNKGKRWEQVEEIKQAILDGTPSEAGEITEVVEMKARPRDVGDYKHQGVNIPRHGFSGGGFTKELRGREYVRASICSSCGKPMPAVIEKPEPFLPPRSKPKGETKQQRKEKQQRYAERRKARAQQLGNRKQKIKGAKNSKNQNSDSDSESTVILSSDNSAKTDETEVNVNEKEAKNEENLQAQGGNNENDESATDSESTDDIPELEDEDYDYDDDDEEEFVDDADTDHNDNQDKIEHLGEDKLREVSDGTPNDGTGSTKVHTTHEKTTGLSNELTELATEYDKEDTNDDDDYDDSSTTNTESDQVQFNTQETRYMHQKKGRLIVQTPFGTGEYPLGRELQWKYSGPCMGCFIAQGPVWMLRGMGNKSRKKTKGFKKITKRNENFMLT